MTLLLTTLFLFFGLALFLGLAFTALARGLAPRCGLVDHPDERRKMHGGAIPVAGGLAIFLAGVAVLVLALLVPSPLRNHLAEQRADLLGLFLGSATICALGVADDYHCLRGRHKLLGQLIAVGIVLVGGVRIDTLAVFGWRIELGLLAIPFTVFWLLGAINSFNLIDGMDGLLGSLGLIVSLAIAALAALHGQWLASCVAFILAGTLLGFLRFNFPPATIFLGDAGSMLIGLVVGVLAIRSCLKGPATVALAAPVALLVLPIFDTSAAIVRRKLTGRSLYSTDRGHLHHCLMRKGLSNRRVLLLVWALCLVTVGGVLASLACQNELLAVVSALLVVAVLVVGRLFGTVEAVLMHKRLSGFMVSLFRGPRAGQSHQVAVRLQGSGDWTDLWERLTASATQFNLQRICLDLNAPAIHEGYHARWDRQGGMFEEHHLWHAEFPLAAQGQPVGRLEVTGQRDRQPVSLTIARIALLVEEIENTITHLTRTHQAAAADGPCGLGTAPCPGTYGLTGAYASRPTEA